MEAQQQLALETDIGITPSLEMGAHEALWVRNNATAKSVFEKLSSAANNMPSSLVPLGEAINAKEKVLTTIQKAKISNFGYRVKGTADYPLNLWDSERPSAILYYQGICERIYRKSVAVVGTRNPSNEGEKRTKQLVKKLLDDNYTIMSGLAKGIDAVAHETAIEAGGETIAVLGTPISEQYPRENEALQKQIAQNHLVVS